MLQRFEKHGTLYGQADTETIWRKDKCQRIKKITIRYLLFH